MRKDQFLCSLCLGALALAAMHSRVSAAPGVSPAISNALNDQIALADHKSGFEVTERLKNRNPFWPVGWVPGMKAKEQVVTTVFNPIDAYMISSIMLGPPDLAVINGKTYEAGQVIPTLLGNQVLQVKIVKIQDGGVLMALGAKPFLVPKNRREPDKAGQPRATPAPAAPAIGATATPIQRTGPAAQPAQRPATPQQRTQAPARPTR